uniref:Uncharacterized protein n=1 Tax=Panagrolaimus sp. PS1159 TaxID=55785 RepID=A0AC35FWL4_9BILA
MSPNNIFEHSFYGIYDDDSMNAFYEREMSKLNGIIAKKDLKIEELEKKNSVFKKRLTKYYKQRHFTIGDYVSENDKLDDKLVKVEEERDHLKLMNKKLTENLSETERKIKKEAAKLAKSEIDSQIYFMKQEYEDKINTLEKLEAEVELTGTIKDLLE